MLTKLNQLLPQLRKSTGLHDLTNDLVDRFSAEAGRNGISFVNEIPVHLPLHADSQVLAPLLHELFLALVSTSNDSCIRVSAKTIGNVILMQVKDANSMDTVAVDTQVQKLQDMAASIKGSVGITSQRKKVTTITVGFPNLPKTA